MLCLTVALKLDQNYEVESLLLFTKVSTTFLPQYVIYTEMPGSRVAQAQEQERFQTELVAPFA